MRYIITNFAYGTGPYLRTTELAIALNRELESAGAPRLGVIVPWVYGEKQKRVMLEEFGEHEAAHPGEILLDRRLGELLGRVFYSGERSYEVALSQWVEQGSALSEEAGIYLSGEFGCEDLAGNSRPTHGGSNIVLELARSPRVVFGVAPVYSVTFGHTSEILEHALAEPRSALALDRRLVERAIPFARQIETRAAFHGLAEPSTFSYLADRKPRYPTEVAIPPTISPPKPSAEPLAEGIYVTITGIPGLERLYAEARRLGLKLYSNDPAAVPGSVYLSPHLIPNPAIKLQFARSGWGSVWLSQLAGTPFVTPAFDPADDPEIYFNNRCIEELGLGVVYRRQPLTDMLREAERLRPGIEERNRALRERLGTLDGNAYAAGLIAARYLGKR